MDRPILIELDWVRAKKPIGRWIDHIELFVGNGDPARQDELCSSPEKCGVCIDHCCQSHPIMYLQHFHAIVESFIFYIKMQKCSHWIPTDHQDSAVLGGVGVRGKIPKGEMGVGGAYHNQAEKYIGRGRFAKSAGRAESKILIAHIFPNSSILLAWQCLWNPKTVLFCRQVSTWRSAQHGGWQGLHC